MNPPMASTRRGKRKKEVLLAVCSAVVLGAGLSPALAQNAAKPAAAAAKPDTAAAASAAPDTSKISPEQLESLVAPVALYPDALLAQTLVASTYPLEIVQLQQWMAKHKDLKDKALVDSVAAQPWDPSIQSMAAIPEVVDRLANDIQWTTDLGNAFLAQQDDVMDAVQRMRKKAKEKGALESNEQMKVEEKVVEKETIIVVESTNPEVIYVPSYSPAVVYGPPLYYPYPPIYYPPYPAGGMFISFSMGVMWGAAWGGSCCGCGWGGGNDIYINNDNNFNNINGGDRGDRGDRGDGGRGEGGRGEGGRGEGGRGEGGRGQASQGSRGDGGSWKHNPSHRGAAPYGDRATANKFGGSARGDSPSSRAGVSNRQQGGASGRPSAGTSNRGSGAGVSNRAGGAAGGQGAANRASPSTGSRGSSGSRGGDQIGSRNVSKSGSGSRSSGFSGGSGGYSRSGANASRSRGSSSMGGRGGGRGGGGRGGGRR